MDLKLFYLLNNLSGKSEIFDWFIIFSAEYLGWFAAAAFLVFLYFSRPISLGEARPARAAFFSKSEKFKIFLAAAISVILSRFVITEIIRFLYCRPRPFTAHIVNQLVGESNCSFPSGHAAFFFALAMAIYFYNKKWGAWFFGAAILISISRIVAGVHYPTDILGGAVIGILSAYVIFRYSDVFFNYLKLTRKYDMEF